MTVYAQTQWLFLATICNVLMDYIIPHIHVQENFHIFCSFMATEKPYHEIFVWHKILLVVPCKCEHFYTYCFQFTQPQYFSPLKLFLYTLM